MASPKDDSLVNRILSNPFKHDEHDSPKIEFELIHPDTFDQGSCAAIFLHGLPAFILS